MTERTVHLVDDDDAIRRSAGFLLKTSGFLVVPYASGDAFLAQAKSAVPGCVLLDIRMPGMDGLEVQQAMIDRGIALPVVMLTGHGDITLAVRAMKAGAVDFLEKPFEKTALLGAVDKAFNRLRQGDRLQMSAADATLQLASLTGRERDVVAGLIQGHPNKTIAFDLGISSRTVEIHRANLMRKLGATSLSDVLQIAFAAKLGADD
ncbi:response regulator transcription factor [Sphingomonas sp. AX6]|uniref:response regulator transcription factor n=1 Tax=Sphingomonas sp. AX6 TaxID=2653171 RepID=UPI0012F2E1FB|nr:response regulator transcription factor [Sphingomonas sp. AX6]VXC84892.1 Transcriptional regulatory protein FixJ [Sphingomonas sp. AX6]